MSSKTCNYRLMALEEGRKEEGDGPTSSLPFQRILGHHRVEAAVGP